jgi:competence protein ComEA
MRRDDDTSTAQRVSRLLDQGRRTEPPIEDDAWPAEWPPGVPVPEPDDDRFGAAGGPRWQVPVPAAGAAVVLAVLVVGIAAVLLLRGPAPGTAVPPRAPGPFSGLPTGLSSTTAAGLGPTPAAAGTAVAGASGDPAVTGDPAAPAGQVRVYVVGQVRRPGVVSLAAEARVEDAVQAAGGASTKADLAVINLARKVIDGERIVVPRPGEKLPTADAVVDPGAGGSGVGAATGAAGSVAPAAPVDLNTATVAQLDALPGVGPVIAGRIVAWRQENGRFSTVDDLSEVQGIGDATMARLRPLVRV